MESRNSRIGLLQVLASGVIMFTAGCSLQYQNAIGGPTGGDSKRARVYREWKETHDAEREAYARSQQGAQFAGPGQSHDNTAQNAEDAEGIFSGDGSAFTSSSGGGLRGLNLYGQLPSTPEHSAGSPLDSPDNLFQISYADEGADFDPSLDGSGSWIAFASTRHRKTSDIYLQRVDGQTVTQLTTDPANDVMPVFSPDGKWVAFASDRAGNWDIWIAPVDGKGPPRQLTSSLSQEIHPSFSPDGTQIVYCSFGAQSGQWEVVVVDVNNPTRPSFIANGLFPAWSPKGDKIAFQRARERGSRWFSVWTVDIEDGQAVRPTEIAASSNAAVITPDWSPDGKHLVFCTVIDPGTDETGTNTPQADVWVIAADGSNRTNLTKSRFMNLQPVWSPDGTVYFVSNRGKGAQENIWAVRTGDATRMVGPVATDPETQEASVDPDAGSQVMVPIE